MSRRKHIFLILVTGICCLCPQVMRIKITDLDTENTCQYMLFAMIIGMVSGTSLAFCFKLLSTVLATTPLTEYETELNTQ